MGDYAFPNAESSLHQEASCQDVLEAVESAHSLGKPTQNFQRL